MIEITASDIARGLGGRKHGSYWTAKCPAHDDKNPSLSISEGTDGAVLVKCHAGCSQDMVIDALRGRGLWPERRKSSDNVTTKSKPAAPKHNANPRQIWGESVDPRGTWAEDYLISRGLVLPADPEILLRTLRFHERCPWEKERVPALVCAFTPILAKVPDDPFADPPPAAIHRIKGRGHDNKKMLGPVKGCAVMISPWWHVCETLHVCEGVETAIALWNEGTTAGADDPDAWQFDDEAHHPVWAMGSAGAIGDLPVIRCVRHLVIWADHDRSETGVRSARLCAERWMESGRRVTIRYPENEGEDYAD